MLNGADEDAQPPECLLRKLRRAKARYLVLVHIYISGVTELFKCF